MSEENFDVWNHYASKSVEPIIDRLRNTGPMQKEDGTWVGRFGSWRDCHEAADYIESLERRINEYEETIRYLTVQVSKNL